MLSKLLGSRTVPVTPCPLPLPTNNAFTAAVLTGKFIEVRKILNEQPTRQKDVTDVQLTYVLSEAVKKDDAGMLLFLQRYGVDLSAPENISIIQRVTSERQPKIAQLLAHFQHDLNKMKSFSLSHLIQAILANPVGPAFLELLNKIQLLLNITYSDNTPYFDPNEKVVCKCARNKSDQEYTLLTAAVESEMPELVALLLNAPQINPQLFLNKGETTFDILKIKTDIIENAELYKISDPEKLLKMAQLLNHTDLVKKLEKIIRVGLGGAEFLSARQQDTLLFKAVMQFILQGKELTYDDESVLQKLYARSPLAVNHFDVETQMTPLTAAAASGNVSLILALTTFFPQEILKQADGNNTTPLAIIMAKVTDATRYVTYCKTQGIILYNSEKTHLTQLIKAAKILINTTGEDKTRQINVENVSFLENAVRPTSVQPSPPATAALMSTTI